MNDTITITKIKNSGQGYSIVSGTWCSGPLSWDEAIGTLAALLVPNYIGHMRPSMRVIQQDLMCRNIIDYFGPEDI